MTLARVVQVLVLTAQFERLGKTASAEFHLVWVKGVDLITRLNAWLSTTMMPTFDEVEQYFEAV